VDMVPVEVADLGVTLNGMLARLQGDFQRLTDFSTDIAHELRTPITNLLTQTEVALSQTREPAKYRDVLASNVEELQRLARMVSDMLYLA
ncbi:histidine kinase dimerization/phospho-acceptor domain-containing protein, partial [Klebsiella pneumoniae]